MQVEEYSSSLFQLTGIVLENQVCQKGVCYLGVFSWALKQSTLSTIVKSCMGRMQILWLSMVAAAVHFEGIVHK